MGKKAVELTLWEEGRQLGYRLEEKLHIMLQWIIFLKQTEYQGKIEMSIN